MVPLTNGDGIFADRKRLDPYLVGRPFRDVIIAAHRVTSAPKRIHFGLPGRRSQLHRGCSARRGRRSGRWLQDWLLLGRALSERTDFVAPLASRLTPDPASCHAVAKAN